MQIPQNNLNSTIVKNINISIPKIEDQTAIAAFLDKKTTRIDTLIEKDKKLIALLKEKRTALINHAVTKGLDPNAKMKDSGIEWIGEISEGWEVNFLKRFCKKITDGSHYSPETVDEGKYYITVGDVKESYIDFENAKMISEDDFELLKRNGSQPNKKDIILSKDGTIGKCVVIEENNFVVLSSLGIITPDIKLDSYYLRYFLLSDRNIKQMFSLIRGSALTRLTISLINNLLVIVPPLPEQTAIANYLDKATSKIDKTIELIEKKINLLEEYKKSLIHYVVTGKVDVRGVEA
jgi:type I restriction enzyme S subunit